MTKQEMLSSLIKDLEANGDSILIVDKDLPPETMKYSDENGNVLIVKVNIAGEKLDIVDYYMENA